MPGDEKGITELFREVFGRAMRQEEWDWKYRGGGQSVIYSVVAVSDDGRIVGHYGGMPLRMVHKGKAIKGMSLGDVMIHPRFRGIKTLKKLTHTVEEVLFEDGFLMVYGFPNDRNLTTPAEKLGLFTRVEDVYEFEKNIKFRSGWDRYAYKLFDMSFDDARIDRLWQSVEKDFCLAVVRDRRYLLWRYLRNPLYQYEIRGLRKRVSSDLSGFVVLKREDGDRLNIMDMVFVQDALSALLLKVENLASVMRKKTVCLWVPSQLQKSVENMGYHARPFGTTIPCTTRPGFLTDSDIRSCFFYTMGDTDFL